MILKWILKKIIFRPVKLKPNHIFNFIPEFTELTFHPHPNVSLSALHFKVNNPKGILIYFHGNKGNLERWGIIASELTRFNYDVIAFDYRSYGKSTGVVSELNLFNDAMFCYTQLKETLNPKEIILYGRSLGTGIASWLSGQINPTKLILETPFYDMPHLINLFVPKVFYTPHLRFSSHRYLKNSTYPILILHGTRDGVVPFISGKKLADSLINPKMQFVTIKGGKHNNLNTHVLYWDSLTQFIEANGH